MSVKDFRVVVAIDFGTTCSGFAYSHTENHDTAVHSLFPGHTASKTNTVLEYDNNWKAINWGFPALVKAQSRRKKASVNSRPVELFKLHLADIDEESKPYLPRGLNYKTAITDFLNKMQKFMLETLLNRWPSLTLPKIRFVFSVPAEWAPKTRGILRECIYKAGFLTEKYSDNLEFISEPEAAAIFCMSILKEHELKVGDSFMVCDCGGGTVDLTTRTLLPENQLGEVTERTGDLCGSTFVDNEFILFLGRRLGHKAVQEFKENHYGLVQLLIHKFFCPEVKDEFAGNVSTFEPIEFDIQRICPQLMSYVDDERREQMEEDEWIIELQFSDVTSMFDPVVEKIIRLVRNQLNASGEQKCSAIFMVGGFAENPYLVSRVKKTFSRDVHVIAVPQKPITTILKGAVQYGLNKKIVKSRRLTWTYGIEVYVLWKKGVDPKKRKLFNGHIQKFDALAKRGTEASPDQKFCGIYVPFHAIQTSVRFRVLATKKLDARFCDEPGMEEIGCMTVNLGIKNLGLIRPIEFSLTFADEEIKATAWNKLTEEIFETKFDYLTE
ncbi:8607_t:CDS:2 [Ambispora gerdemannii]|uniref:8607_t:CDS:1 n=1 Tax=Ambispora gerdemannii TaxID=144530 RepID=A0A9N8V438_9GLOM|nr:8607_t:CDS:2 [Ambispora gerdemannii]